jgi:hypothetical protein
METPPIIQASLLRILKYGLLNIRYYSEGKNLERCAIEANHLHNIPSLIETFSVDLLKFYIDTEMPQYVRETNNQVPEEFRRAWIALTDWLSQRSSA